MLTNPHAVVEFFGLPGVGKSTAAILIEDALRNTGVDVVVGHDFFNPVGLTYFRRNFRRVILIARELPHTFSNCWGIRSLVLMSQRSIRDKIKAIYNVLTLQSLVSLAARKKCVLLLDQGVFQTGWSLAMFSREESDLPNLIDKLRQGVNCRWHVIVLEAEQEVILERVMNRTSKHSRLQLPNAIGDFDAWTNGKRLIDGFMNVILDLADDAELTMETHSTTSAIPEEVAHQIIAGNLFLELAQRGHHSTTGGSTLRNT